MALRISGPIAGVRRLGPELRGILIMLLAFALFGCMDALSKVLVSHYPAPFVLWMRHLAALPVAFLMFARRRPLRLLRTRVPMWQLARSALLAFEMNLVLLVFAAMPLADAQALLAVTPLVVTALSVPLLGERVGWRRWLAVAAGFLGVLVILRPGVAAFQPGALLALLCSVLYAIYNVMTRKVAEADRPETSFLLQIVIGAVLLSCIGPFYWVTPAPMHWPLILLQATLGAFGHYLVNRALWLAPANVVQPITYTSLIYATVLGYLVFGNLPDRWTVLGGLIVVGAGVYAAFRARRREVERGAA